MEIAILLFDGLTALDAVGPYEVLKLMPAATLRFVAKQPGPQRVHGSSLTLVATDRFEDVSHPDIVLVPGGPGERVGTPDANMLD